MCTCLNLWTDDDTCLAFVLQTRSEVSPAASSTNVSHDEACWANESWKSMHNQEGSLKIITKNRLALISADCLKCAPNFSISGYLRPIALPSQDSDWIKIFAELEVGPMNPCMPGKRSTTELHRHLFIQLLGYSVVYLNTGLAWN